MTWYSDYCILSCVFHSKVETTQEITSQEMIPEILDRVEKLVDFALDVVHVDMAEECRDPDIPYYSNVYNWCIACSIHNST